MSESAKLSSDKLATAHSLPHHEEYIRFAQKATATQSSIAIHSHPIEEKIDPEGEMDGVFETCHLAGYEKTKTPPSIGCKVQRQGVWLDYS
ncbi:MAG: hypothetical protein NTZ08_13690 [Verrucomicrobia bacterium]|nr:hypothetical protein [Verrucomicrobiota bacterium]